MTTTKKTPAADSQSTSTTAVQAPAPRSAAVVGPPLPAGAAPETVVLSHHLRIDGVDYAPGSTIRVSPDYARRLRAQGYTARSR
jgi:hypothetical protein